YYRLWLLARAIFAFFEISIPSCWGGHRPRWDGIGRDGDDLVGNVAHPSLSVAFPNGATQHPPTDRDEIGQLADRHPHHPSHSGRCLSCADYRSIAGKRDRLPFHDARMLHPTGKEQEK